MKRLLLAALVLATPASALASKLDRLSTAEQAHFEALKVWMDDKAQKSFLKLKTEGERDQWLKDHHLWDRFYRYDQHDRDQIVAKEVAVGWSEDRVYMAWGAPHQKQRLARQGAERSEMLIYEFEVAPDGAVLVWAPGSKVTHGAIARFRYEIVLDDGVVAEMHKKQGWDDGQR
jgi:hypothetical protein